jgi:methylase of polypeptide subunit release factors
MQIFKSKLLTRDAIERLYQELLGRGAESEAVIQSHLRGHKTIASLRKTILASPEHLNKQSHMDLWKFVHTNICRTEKCIEVEVSENHLQEIFNRIAKQWSALGESDAHWSVITNEKFRHARFSEHEDEFFQSGRHTASLIDLFAERNGVELDKGHLVEIGCGTGRITTALAESFEKVTAVDISSDHLELCKEILIKNHQDNVDLLHLKSPSDISILPECSFLFSAIVLQHNPPPMIHYILDHALAKVRRGGAALFQVPTHTADYEFRASHYLSSQIPSQFEMHCIPMHHIFTLLHKHGFKALEVIMDGWTGMPGSHTFFSVKN